MKVFLTILILFSFGTQSNCSEQIRNIIHTNSRYLFDEISVEGEGRSQSLVIRSSVDGEKGKKLASLEYDLMDDPQELYIGLMYTREDLRAFGLQTLLFREVIKRNTSVKKFSAQLVSTNEEVILRKMIEKFIRTDAKMNIFRPTDTIEKQFESCCGDLFRSLSSDKQNELILEGLKNTPYYKTQKKIGLSLCTENPYDIRTSTYHGEFSINLYVSFCL
jgi:hypothetical protein